jgi:hypothetical protein
MAIADNDGGSAAVNRQAGATVTAIATRADGSRTARAAGAALNGR